MNLNQVREIVKEDTECNFIAMAITPLQAAGVDAALSYLKSKGVILSGYILIANHPNTGAAISENNFYTHEEKIKFLYIDYVLEDRGILNVIKNRLTTGRWCCRNTNNPTFYVIWTEVYNNLYYCAFDKIESYNVTFIQIDDGAASYIDDYKLRLSCLIPVAKTLKRKLLAHIKAFSYGCFSKVYRCSLLKNERYIRGTLFVKKVDKRGCVIRRNDVIAPFYVDVFRSSSMEFKKSLFKKRTVLINTQCLYEANVTDGVVDLEVYEELADILASLNINTVLKPHPREKNAEKYEKFAWELLVTPYPQETIIASCDVKPRCVISIYSSTLLNITGLFGIPAISLARMLLNKDISMVLRNELKQYIDMYDGVIMFPNNGAELKKILHDIYQEK